MNKASFLFLLLLIGVCLIGYYQATIDQPVANAMIKTFALIAYLLLCISLIIGPLVLIRPTDFAQLIEPRRAVGIAAFVFALIHYVLVAGSYFGWDISQIGMEKSNIVGFIGLVTLVLLTITSNDYSIKKLGPVNWKRIQMINYLTFIIVSVHFIAKSKGDMASNILLGLGAITIIFQIYGFFLKRSKMQKNNEQTKSIQPTE